MKWQTLRHNGVAFPPPYDYRGLTVRIAGERVQLEPLPEEMLMAWAKKKDTPYVLDPVFQQNFLDDLKKVLPERFAGITLAEIDFSELHAIAERDKTAHLSDDEKKQRAAERKRTREELKAKFGTAIIDGVETEVGAYLVEPPGLLMGRGAHPLRGKWKRRVVPEDVTLNLDEDAPIPPAPAGHHWGEIVHEHDSMWIASWHDELSDKRKYIWLADSARLRQERDKGKYVQAAKLETSIARVRAEIAKRMDYRDAPARAALEHSRERCRAQRAALEERLLAATAVGDRATRRKLEDQLAQLHKQDAALDKRFARLEAAERKTRQLATVCYLIDRLAMRVGDEKDEDEADTVGASTLRVEHIRLNAASVEFNFLGKDSVEWQKALPRDHDGALLARNLEEFMRGKQPGDQVFDQIDSTHVNRFLGSIVEGLTAKVFRTFHATVTVRDYLRRQAHLTPDAPMYEKEYVAKLANLEAAVVCNHKRTPPKNWQASLAKREAELARLRAASPNPAKFEAQIRLREQSLQKWRAAPPDPAKLAAQVHAREEALQKAQAAVAALPQLDARVQARQAALDRWRAAQKSAQAAAQEILQKKQAALAKLEKYKPPKAKRALAAYKRRLRAARQAVAETKKANDAKLERLAARVAAAQRALKTATRTQREQTRRAQARLAHARVALERARHARETKPLRYAERLAQAEEALAQARRASEAARQNHAERVERAARQLDLAKRTRDYNLGTSLKNYIDPRVYKAWGDYIGYDWKRLYTKALQRKFAWVERERTQWRSVGVHSARGQFDAR